MKAASWRSSGTAASAARRVQVASGLVDLATQFTPFIGSHTPAAARIFLWCKSRRLLLLLLLLLFKATILMLALLRLPRFTMRLPFAAMLASANIADACRQ
ncbi:MAG: hypothetical protein JSS58_00570 [Proteobacteria bacterium]|nr:hypothetical protein [Pseudomonadota bacterium]